MAKREVIGTHGTGISSSSSSSIATVGIRWCNSSSGGGSRVIVIKVVHRQGR